MDPPAFPAWQSHPSLQRFRAQIQSQSDFAYSAALSQDIARTAIVLEPQTEAKEESHLEEETDGEERLEQMQKRVGRRREFQVELIRLRTEARQRLQQEWGRRQEQLRALEERSAYQAHSHHFGASIHSLKAEHRLRRLLKAEDGSVSIHMREGSDPLFSGSLRAYQVTWRRRPQPLEVRIHQCRTIREKLEEGQYSLRVKVWDRLGGRPIGFAREDPAHWKHQTEKVEHIPTAWELLYDDSLEILAPSEKDLRPCMVLIFELVCHTTRDEIVGTGVFPLCNCELDYAQGQFKTPILRGILHHRVQQFAELERLYSANVDDWLCNLYFQIRKQTVLLAGQREYTVLLTSDPDTTEQVTSRGFQEMDYETLRTPDQFSGFRQSVVQEDSYSSPITRAKYLAMEVLAELGVGRYAQVAVTVVVMLVWVWVSRYLHYLGQYLFLKGERVPVTGFQVKLYTIDVQYPDQMSLEVEIGATVMGPFFTLSCFLFLALSTYTALRTLGKVPAPCYRLLSAFGLITVCDGLITAIETICRQKEDGDIYKLYNYFGREEGSPAIGGFLTAFLYLGIAGISLFAVYIYLLYCHMNGRLLDVFVRLTAPERHFFLPRDCEVSARYLDWVLAKARAYRAANGDRRRISLSEYSQSGHLYRHISIYTEGVNHSRLLHRHFLILPTGAMCELALSRL